jgi:hypothetical protein
VAKARTRATFHDSLGRFASPRDKGVRVWKSGKRLTGKQREKKIRESIKEGKPGRISRGFPKGYTSPFRAFIVPREEAHSPERAFALVEIISRRKYEGTAYKNWIPFDLGYMPPDVARALDDNDVREQFKLSTLKGRNELSKIFGFFMLRPEAERRKALTPRLLRLIKYRARHGNEEVKALPERLGRKGARRKKGKRKGPR